MKIAVIAAGALAAAALASPPDASAKDLNFGLTIGEPNGYLQISAPGPDYPTEPNKNYNRGNGYGQGYGNGQGYQQPYNGSFNLRQARAQGDCLYPNEIRRRLRREGWYNFKIRKIKPRIAIAKSRYQGARYRLKVDRCTGRILKARAIGGYGEYTRHGRYNRYGKYGGYGGYGYRKHRGYRRHRSY